MMRLDDERSKKLFSHFGVAGECASCPFFSRLRCAASLVWTLDPGEL